MGLCLAIGGMTFGEMLGRMNRREVCEWLAYAARNGPVDPNYRADLRSAIIASVIANAHRGKRQRAFKHKDFMPYWREPKVELTVEQQFEGLKAMLGAKPANAVKPKKKR